ncbi:15691_t:CDS:2, partial [Entrophospora sp. SA101]
EKRPKIKGQNDLEKFDKARELDKHLENIRRDYRNKKTGKNADTVGCCSLRCEHITLVSPRTV